MNQCRNPKCRRRPNLSDGLCAQCRQAIPAKLWWRWQKLKPAGGAAFDAAEKLLDEWFIDKRIATDFWARIESLPNS